jgi:HAMP domain-containing protein
MNPDAMDALIGANQSYFSHQDQIGALTYGSAYLPIINHKRQQIGFINLQLFGQQEAYEQQIENFLKAAINVFVLLLAISVFIALVVSNWLIGPLQAVARSVRTLEFGKNNQKITYNNQDEIGLLVKAYNEKLAELEHAAGQIARSERESAWRDLAQQIAHEIKNPLTPMKLSIQHLLRKIEMQDADAPQLNSMHLLNKSYCYLMRTKTVFNFIPTQSQSGFWQTKTCLNKFSITYCSMPNKPQIPDQIHILRST